MVNTLRLHRNGVVGFTDWLDVFIDISSESSIRSNCETWFNALHFIVYAL